MIPFEIPPLPFLSGGVAQVAFVVEDLEESVQAYHRHFGIGPWTFYTYGPELVKRMTYRGQPSRHSMRVALSNLGPTRIELVQPEYGKTVFTDFVERRGYGIHHLGFLVEDMTAALEMAKNAGFPMIQDGAGFGLDGDGHYAYLDTESRFGILFELIERPKRRVAPEKVFPAEGGGLS